MIRSSSLGHNSGLFFLLGKKNLVLLVCFLYFLIHLGQALSSDTNYSNLEDKKSKDYSIWNQDLTTGLNTLTLTLGLNSSSGNINQSQETGNINYINHHNQHMEHLVLQYVGTKAGSIKRDIFHAKAGYAFGKTNNFHFLLNGRFDRDNGSGYDNRLSYGVGVARVLNSDKTSRLSGILSIDNNSDKVKGKSADDYWSSTATLMYSKVFSKSLSLTNSIVFSKALSNSTYFYDIDTKLAYRIGKNWSISADYDVLYRSEDLGGVLKNYDTRFIFGLTYNR